ncbi:MAG TPA: hypothetical protein VFV40_09220 [Nocardioides sp.]|nr:hypothetical protein [Nocardioides sp.]
MELAWIDDTDGQAAADALVATRSAQREAEATELALATHWATLHDEDSLPRGGARPLPGHERARQLGGLGTPLVAEFAVAELAVLTGRGRVAAETFVADALDVRHRAPQLWAAVMELRVAVWQARRIVARLRAVGLDREQARWVDSRVTPYVPSLPWARIEALLEAKVIEVDPEAAAERARAAALEQFVSTGQCNEYGLKTLVAKAASGDVVFFVAMCDRIAQVLLERGDTSPVGVRRAKALGILADPARALTLLAEHAMGAGDGDGAAAEAGGGDGAAADGLDRAVESSDAPGAKKGVADDDGAMIAAADLHPADDDSDDAAEGAACTSCGASTGAGRRSNWAGTAGPVGDPAAFVKALATIDPRKLMPSATLYVHVAREDLPSDDNDGTGVARVEGLGPVLTGQVREWLRHRNVRVVPVLDLADVHSGVDSYEVPTSMREILRLRGPAGADPWSSNLSRRKDADHTVPYSRQGGPAPPQTRVANLGLLDRTGHRIKTHGRGWKHRQPRPGVYLWRTPHGYWVRVDRTGTHLIGSTPSPYDLEGLAPDPRSAHERALADLVREHGRPD